MAEFVLTPAAEGDIVAFARLHQAHDQGLPMWRERPDHIRKNTVARVPPMLMIKEQR